MKKLLCETANNMEPVSVTIFSLLSQKTAKTHNTSEWKLKRAYRRYIIEDRDLPVHIFHKQFPHSQWFVLFQTIISPDTIQPGLSKLLLCKHAQSPGRKSLAKD